MVDRGMHHLHITGDVCILEGWHMRKTRLTIVILMAFDVSLILQVDTIFITEIIPVWCIRIVTVAHVVDIGTLHQEYLLLHLLATHRMTRIDIVLMTVHTLQFDRLAVQIIVATCQSKLILVGRRILDFHLTETHDGGEGLHGLALRILQLAHQSIAIRSLGTP